MVPGEENSSAHTIAFVRRAILRIVIGDVRRTDTGNQALQHLGILWLIYGHSTVEAPITTVRLAELTGVNPASLIRFTERLAKLDLIIRSRTHGSHGKGKAWTYASALPASLLREGVVHIALNARAQRL